MSRSPPCIRSSRKSFKRPPNNWKLNEKKSQANSPRYSKKMRSNFHAPRKSATQLFPRGFFIKGLKKKTRQPGSHEMGGVVFSEQILSEDIRFFATQEGVLCLDLGVLKRSPSWWRKIGYPSVSPAEQLPYLLRAFPFAGDLYLAIGSYEFGGAGKQAVMRGQRVLIGSCIE